MTFEMMLVCTAFLLVGGLGLLSWNKTRIWGKILLTLISLPVVGYGVLVAALVTAFDGKEFYALLAFVFGILLLALILCSLWGAIRKKAVWLSLCCCLAAAILATAGYAGYQVYIDSIPVVAETGNEMLAEYAPYAEDTKVAELDAPSKLKLTENLPRMDGATALYPIYSAFAKAVYPKDVLYELGQKNEGGYVLHYNNEYLACNTTAGAYDSIVLGDSDIVFAAMASDEQLAFAEEQGVTLEFTPIGREAFVFFVNAKNPLEDIMLEQIQGIYSGEITAWDALGVNGLGNIRAFQRDEGSGSQSTLVRMMGEKELMQPPKEEVVTGMGGIIKQTADYKNYKNAIGYSFRFYSTQMVGNAQIKLLSVGGAAPTTENIENGTYPLASHFYAVTRSDASENTKKLLAWILSEQGQELIERTGYTPLK